MFHLSDHLGYGCFIFLIIFRLWMFLQLRPAWNGEPRDSVTESQKYFRARFQRTAAASQDIGGGRFHTKILSIFSLKYKIRKKDLQILLSAHLKYET
jgi:hypothetical protein